MINIQKKTEAKWMMSLGLALFMGLANMTVLNGMKSEQPEKFAWQDLEEISKDIKQCIKQLEIRNAITFLGLYGIQPIATLKIDKIGSIAVAGGKLVTGSGDGTAKIWDINTGQLLCTLKDHTKRVGSVAVAGDKVVTGSLDNTAKIWDIKTGDLLYTLKDHTKQVEAVAVAGDKVVTGSVDKTAKIWDIKTGDLLYTLKDHTKSVCSVVVGGDKVVTGSFWDGTANIWDVNTGQLLRTIFVDDTDSIDSVALAGDKVVTRSGNNANIWDIKTGQLLRTIVGMETVRSVAVAGDKVVIGGLSDCRAKVWDIKTGQLLCALKDHTDVIELIAAVGDKVATGSRDKTVKIWDLSINLQGTSQDNPLVWIMQNATIPQLDFIKRAYGATIAEQDLIIAMPTQLGKIQKCDSQEQIDGNIYFSFPEGIRAYLRACLNVRKVVFTLIKKVAKDCIIQ